MKVDDEAVKAACEVLPVYSWRHNEVQEFARIITRHYAAKLAAVRDETERACIPLACGVCAHGNFPARDAEDKWWHEGFGMCIAERIYERIYQRNLRAQENEE